MLAGVRVLSLPTASEHANAPSSSAEATRVEIMKIDPNRIRRYSRVSRSRNALPTTLTEESAIAAAAMIGDSRMPNAG